MKTEATANAHAERSFGKWGFSPLTTPTAPAHAIILAQKRCEIIAEEAKAKQSEAGGDRRSEAYRETASVQMDKSDSEPINTQKEVAKLAGVSTGTED